MPKLYVRTYGCQANDRDSEAITGLFLQEGYRAVKTPDEADVILVNTCSVREHAENRAISFLGSLKKKAYSVERIANSKNNTKTLDANRYPLPAKPIIGLIGCMAKARGEEIFKKMPHVDLIVSPNRLDKIPVYVEQIRTPLTENRASRPRIIDIEDTVRDEELYRAPYRIEADHAQIVISTGCSNYCSYCVVPYVRGPLRLRAPENIISEVKRDVTLGIKRITLLGQNVNDYLYIEADSRGYQRGLTPVKIRPSSERSGRPTSFVDLLKMVTEIEGIEEVDFITSHPHNTSKELFEEMSENLKIKKHIHLPFQSGSDRILQLMNRGYTQAEYLCRVSDYKRIVGGTLSADVIVGFPTERDEDFQATREVIEKVQFDYAYIFKYSTRPGSKASRMPDDVSTEVKEQRHKELLQLQKNISLQKVRR